MTAKVYYADLWGLREVYEEDAHGERTLTGGKYHWLWQNELSTTEWTPIEPQAPFYRSLHLKVKLSGSIKKSHEPQENKVQGLARGSS